MSSAARFLMDERRFPRQVGWRRGDSDDALLWREWLVTNALGGYASGTIGGACTRRFHGQLIAAMPAPLGRVMMFNHLAETVVDGSGECLRLSGDEQGGGQALALPEPDFLEEFVLEAGLPVWRYSRGAIRIEKRLVMPHLQNTTFISYTLLDGPDDLTLELRPSLHFRPHEGLLTEAVSDDWKVELNGCELQIADGREYPPLRLLFDGAGATFAHDVREFPHVLYRLERDRGYEFEGPLWSPGAVRFRWPRGSTATLVASVEPWDVMRALSPEAAFANELARRKQLLATATPRGSDNTTAQLVLAADQFLIRPRTRHADDSAAVDVGEEPRTVVAGYHWFTDWGRDTMISLEGLTLVTGRHREARNILRMFGSYIRNGLIPNLFPEGKQQGLYHTADATMWFFHALHRYVAITGDRDTLRELLPKLLDVIAHHVRGTSFGIGVDPEDGLLRQGAEGYQLTWMDAKVDGWVVTPRRGKAVEINALFYNALRILETFCGEEGDDSNARRMQQLAERVQQSFNARFWSEATGCLFDVVDAEGGGDDASIRPNQILAMSLAHPVLDPSRWNAVLEVVRGELVTPVGLRSLARSSPDYKSHYDGDLRTRDAAYHQGTVWAWLIGPFLDAWLRVHPDAGIEAHQFLDGFEGELGDSCIGTISEVFDAEAPFIARGCASQAWSVAELLRCCRRVRSEESAQSVG